MPLRKAAVVPDLAQSLAQSYAINERMNQVVLHHLDPAAWRAKLPGGKGRTIAAIFSHMHNMRRKWLRLSAPHIKLPAPLDATRCSPAQVRTALAESAECCCAMIADALVRPDRRVEQFHRDGWGRPWPAGAAMVTFMISHDAHHRGQICQLAHQLGFPLPVKAGAGMWVWEKLSKECGFPQLR